MPVYLNCPFLIVPSVFSNVYSCCQYLWIVNSLFPVGFRQRLFMLPVSLDCPSLIAPSVFSNVYSCCQCLWIVHPWLPLRFSLTFIHVASVSWLPILDCHFSFLGRLFMLPVYLDCPFLIALRFSLTFIHVVSVSGLSILDCPFDFL